MINIESKKGITLVSLVITIIVLLILTGLIITSVKLTSGTKSYDNMVSDIKLLEDKTLVYYNKYSETPKTSRTININGTEYYEIDLSKLEGLTLNYGDDYGREEELTEDSDVYLVNSNLHVYYLKGVETNGEIQHVK